MNKNILIVLGGAVLVAVLVAMLVQVTLGGKKTESDAPKVQVLVAGADLAVGRELKEGDTRWQDWPQDSLFPGAIVRKEEQKPEEAIEGRLGRMIAKGEPVVKSALLGSVKGNLVAASLEPGQRAIAIEVKAASMVGGFISAGDYVDVMLTYKASAKTSDKDPRVKEMLERSLKKMATETILQNVKVLAVDQKAQRPEDDEKIKVGKTVTLAVSAEDAERLFLATQVGDLSLVLRGVGDNEIVERTWPTVSDARLTNVEDEIFKNYQKLKEEAGGVGGSVKIYSGDSVQTVNTR